MGGSLTVRAKWVGGLAVAGVLVLGGCAWGWRDQLLSWYFVRGLALASETDRGPWAERVLRLDAVAMPALLGCLRQGDRACANAGFCLTRMAERWGPADARSVALVQQIAKEFARFSPTGAGVALRLERDLGQLVKGTSVPAALVRAAAESLRSAVHVADARVRAGALELALSPLGRARTEEMVLASRELARGCLADEDAGNRVLALRLALQPGIDLREPVVALLHDPVAEIRRTAMLEIGPLTELISTDELLRWLHDPDAEVGKLCEAALRGRGLHADHIRMARLMTDPRAGVRLRVLDYLNQHSDLEPGVWLRRLSHDPAPAVRAASLRQSVANSSVDLSDRIEQMAQNDPSPTIRQLARFYLSSRKPE